LNNLFGTHWSEVMIKWFEDNFPQLHHIKIKTVE
jgi:aspartyl/asparaginyl beta-hydroxylase (cupin superfamily)